MNNRNFPIVIVLAFIYFNAISQQAPFCGSDVALSRLFGTDSITLHKHQQIEQNIYREFSQGSPPAQRGAPTLYVLPVAVHIIHNNGTENISDVQVQQAITYINQAYANVGYYDSTTGVNTQIQFCLAKQDPQGLISTGITRVQSTLTDLDMSTQDLQMKNLSRWNPLCYANIYVVKEICDQGSCGVAGYAYFPSSHGSNIDGLVVEARYFGTSPGYTSVATHELGHYLGLYHTFQGGCTNNNCLADGDRVCDTPPDQSTAGIACSGSANTCSTDALSGFPSDQPDLNNDYMDYGNIPCFNIFTAGQRDRMLWTIANVRSSLLNCPSCNNPCTSAIAALFTTSPANANVGGTVTFSNSSTGAATYSWYLNGQVFSNAVSPNYTFNTQGTYIIRLKAVGSDVNCISYFNDTIHVTCGVQASFNQSTTQVNVGQSITFMNTSTGGATSYGWYVDGILQSASSTTFSYTFNTGGIYPVYLIAYGPLCNDTTSLVNFIHVGQPCSVSFTHAPQQPTTCLPVTFTPDTTCLFNNYYWSFCQPASFGIPAVQNYPVTGPLPAAAKLLKDQNGNYHVYYVAYNTTSAQVNTVYRMDFGNSINNTPVLHPLYTPSITATYGHGVDVVYDGGNYYGFAIYYNSIYRLDFGSNVTNDSPTVTQVTGFTASNINWATKVELVHETNTWWLIIAARTGGTLTILYLGTSITNNVQTAYYNSCPQCWGFCYQKVNGNHYVYATGVYTGMRLMSFGNSLANTPTSSAWATYGTGLHGDVALYQNCDGSFEGVIMKEDQPTHTIIHLSSITATPTIVVNSFSNGLIRSGQCGRIVRTDAGLTMFAAEAYNNNMAKLNFPGCGIANNTAEFPPPVYYPLPGTYRVQLAVDEGLPTQQTYCENITVTGVNARPINLGNDTTICLSQAFTLHAGPGFNSYLWSNGTNDSINTIYGAGRYWVEARDNCNNISRDTIVITVDSATTIMLRDTTICLGNNVTLSAPLGFTTYDWTPAASLSCASCRITTATPIDTTAYTVTAHTAAECVNSASAIVNVISCGGIPTATSTHTNVICGGDSTGSAHVSILGGTPQYHYSWSTGDTTSTLTGLAAGTYYVTVTDANNNIVTDTVFITQPAPLTLALLADSASCVGAHDGSVNSSISGGTPNYQYAWSNGPTTPNLNNVRNGTYILTVTDNNFCSVSDTAIVGAPIVISMTASITSIYCEDENTGAIKLNPSGGTPPYQPVWSNGDTSLSITDLAQGVYSVTIIDAHGCEKDSSFTLTPVSSYTVDVVATNATCESIANGQVDAVVSGNTSPYTYLWNTGDTIHLIQVASGFYSVTVTDSLNCLKSDSVYVGVSGIEILTEVTNATCPEMSDGSIIATVIGGSPPYNYSWSSGAGVSFLEKIKAGIYSLTVTDQNNCSGSDMVVVLSDTSGTYDCDTLIIYDVFSPNGDATNETWVIDGLESFPDNELQIFNRWGSVVFEDKPYTNNWDGHSKKNEPLPSATYYYLLKLNDSKQSVFSGNVTLIR